MSDDRVTETEHTRADGTTTRTTVVRDGDTSSGGGGKWVLIILLIVLAIGAFVIFGQMSGAEVAKDNAVADAAGEVGDAAGQVGDAAQDAADNLGN